MKKKILILGSNGLIGGTLFNFFKKKNLLVYPALRFRWKRKIKFKNAIFYPSLEDLDGFKCIEKIIYKLNPDCVINCTGITKHHKNQSKMVQLNILFPKFLAKLQNKKKFTNIHLSTDCIFSGNKGNYKENSFADAKDNYGRTKSKIEKILVKNKSAIILRTSTIGHEMNSSKGLLNWFLNKKRYVHGFSNAFFSGPTTLELAKIIYKYIIKKKYLKNDIYNISSFKISKYDLLMLIKKIYKKKINIIPYPEVKIDRSLSNKKFVNLTHYKSSSWDKMINYTKKFHE